MKINIFLRRALPLLALTAFGGWMMEGSSTAFAAGKEDSLAKKSLGKPKKAFHWPHGAKAAISLTHDDGCPTHLTNAVPTLDKYGLKGTFFLIGDDVKGSEDKWMAVSKAGHELGSHTMFHPCPREVMHQEKGKALEDYTLERLDKEMDDSIAVIQRLTGKKGPFPFSYPCGDNNAVGEKGNQQSYIPLVAKKFMGGTNMYGDGIVDPRRISFTEIPSSPEGAKYLSTPDGRISFAEIPQMGGESEASGEDLIKMVQKAQAQGGWASFCFHGVGGDWITTKLEAYEKLCDYLSKNRDKVWVAPFGEVVGYLKSEQK